MIKISLYPGQKIPNFFVSHLHTCGINISNLHFKLIFNVLFENNPIIMYIGRKTE